VILVYFFVDAQFLFAAVLFYVRGFKVEFAVSLQAPHFYALGFVYQLVQMLCDAVRAERVATV
jgi:hypothetical protein